MSTSEGIPGLISSTIVGSLIDKKGLEGISDVDLVIILDNLSKNRFETTFDAFNSLKVDIKKNTGLDLFINSSLGPLKFNKTNTIVLHLMMYDVRSHIEHCIKSPFTCLDWQRSKVYTGKSLPNIFPINTLQPRYFFNSRRGIEDYLKDLRAGTVSYREYNFYNGVSERVKFKQMSNKDRFEFSFHIFKFCMLNFLKLYYQKNIYFQFNEISERYLSIFSLNKQNYIDYLKKILNYKATNNFPSWSKEDDKIVSNFLGDFEKQFNNYFKDKAISVCFVRHQKTKDNLENFFFGKNLDSDIIPLDSNTKNNLKNIFSGYPLVFSSPLKRAINSAKNFSKKVLINKDLIEIDYGLVDGKDLSYLAKNFPDIIRAWKEGKDPQFPGGENQEDVLKRVKNFLDFLKNETNINSVVFTHNIFLRCLLGDAFNISPKDWFKIKIDHLDPIRLIITNDKKIYLDIDEIQIRNIFKEFIIG